MKLENRIEAFSLLGERLSNADFGELYPSIRAKNDWFTREMVDLALEAIFSKMLIKKNLEDWVSKYEINQNSPLTVALVLAGNIPAVGFHDILCVLISGNKAKVKLSSKDPIIIPFILEELINIEPAFKDFISYTEKLTDFDAVIATGSSTSNVYFQHYFNKYPSILRSNRKSVGVLFNDSTKEDLLKMADDIFLYYGLGCRNISKLFIEKGVSLPWVMEVLHERKEIVLHNKYKNNYDYNYTVSLLNGDDFLMNGAVLLRKDDNLHSRIATIHYQLFSDLTEVDISLKSNNSSIQCIVSKKKITNHSIIFPGKAQFPELSDYADNIDTMHFLISL